MKNGVDKVDVFNNNNVLNNLIIYLFFFPLETLRKYPVLVWLSRTALVDYTFSGTKIIIPRGQQVFIPVYAIQMDPEVYPNPQVFDPERFLGDNAKNRHSMFFLPFGDGPRNCIGKIKFSYSSYLKYESPYV